MIPDVTRVEAPAYSTPLVKGEVLGILTVPETPEPTRINVNRSEVACWTDLLELVPGDYPVVWNGDGVGCSIDAFLVESDTPALFGGVRMTSGYRDGGMRPDKHHVGLSYGYQLATMLQTADRGYEPDVQHGGKLVRTTLAGFPVVFRGDLEVIATAVSVYPDHTHVHYATVLVDRHTGHDPAHAHGDACEHGKLPWQGCMTPSCCRGGCFEPKLTPAAVVT